MTIRLLNILIPLLIPIVLSSQTLTHAEATNFVRALIQNDSSLVSWFDQNDFVIVHRLGIEYDRVVHKNLISFDLDDTIKRRIREGRLGYSVAVDSLDIHYTRVMLTMENAPPKEYIFKNKKLISALSYYAREWTVIDSDHFRFFLSDSSLFNEYCIEELEAVVARMGVLLGWSARDMQILHEKKIYYYFCRNEDEIQQLTGYRARGMYNLASDAVITTFNAHEHELLHLLINFTLRHLPLYTHPLLQEGVAVAYGGRGGLKSNTILPVGNYLIKSQFVDLPALLEDSTFHQLDASVSYPAAGLYSLFLIKSMGIQAYLQLYRKHSGMNTDSCTRLIRAEELPDEIRWRAFLASPNTSSSINFDTTQSYSRPVYETPSVKIAEDKTRYYFLLSGDALLPGNAKYAGYRSTKFMEYYPKKAYNGEKYLIHVTAEEISVYNLFTNDLIASYVASLCDHPMNVPQMHGRYCFCIRKEIFEDLALSSSVH